MRRFTATTTAMGCFIASFMTMAVAPALAQEVPPVAAEAPALTPPTSGEEPEVLTRGPIHEAFAEPVTDPEPGILVPRQPPADVAEVPPEFAPDLEDAIWIKGYWAWDDEREDFIWISGVSRVPPPGMRWVPGYWNEVDGTWQWVSGFWTKADAEELLYREPPPESLEAGPTSPSPGDDYYYVPGYWQYDAGYRWSPGYWAVYRPNYIWVPARWCWTPRGCIFLPGYHDHLFARRGCMYAPLYFQSAFYARPGYFYRPWCALNVGNLALHFWVRPNYGHYYFGDFYGGWGGRLTPWHRWHYVNQRRCYDPLLAWNDCHFRRQGINYTDRIGSWHRHYDRHPDRRPPRTWNDQVRLVSQNNVRSFTEINRIQDNSVRQNVLAARVDELAKVQNSSIRLKKLDETQLASVKRRADLLDSEFKAVRQQRRELERREDVALKRPDGGRAEGDRPGSDRPRDPRPDLTKGQGSKGDRVRAEGDADAQVRAGDRDARLSARGQLKLPAPIVKAPKVDADLPATPRRAVPRPTVGGPRGDEPASNQLDPRTKGGGPRARGPNPGDDRGRPPQGEGSGERRLGLPDATPRIDSPRGGEGVTPPGDRPGREPRTKGPPATKAPRVEIPSGDRPAVESPADSGRRNLPDNQTPRTTPRGGKDLPSNRTPDRPPAINRPGADPVGNDRPTPERLTPREPRVERDRPSVERVQPRGESPRVETPRNTPRVEIPKAETPRSAPRIDRPDGGSPAPRVNRSSDVPRSAAPRAEPGSSPPRVQTPRSAPRIERPASASRASQPSQPRVQAERSQPRVQAPRPQSRSSPASSRGGNSQPRSEGGGGGGKRKG